MWLWRISSNVDIGHSACSICGLALVYLSSIRFFLRAYIGIENYFADSGQLLTSCEALICTWCWWWLLPIEDVDTPDFFDFLLQHRMLLLFWCLLGWVKYIENYHRTMLPCWHYIRCYLLARNSCDTFPEISLFNNEFLLHIFYGKIRFCRFMKHICFQQCSL